MLDPETGVGACLISGGASGGWAFVAMIALFGIFIGVGLLALSWVGLILAGWAFINFDSWLNSLAAANNKSEFDQNNASTAIALLIGPLIALFGIGNLGVPLLIFAEGFAYLLGLI